MAMTSIGAAASVIAVDLGGTHTKLGRSAPDGTLDEVDTVDTARGTDGSVPVDWLVDLVRTRAAAAGALGFGVAVPGIVTGTGRVEAATNIGWYGIELAERLRAGTGLRGQVGHDVRSGGLAEWRLGSGRGVQNFCFLPLGTGIAGAFVCDGRVITGDGYAGEVGHVRVPAAGELACACGQIGCLELISSAAGVRRSLARARGIDLSAAPPTHLIADAARGGDPVAREAFEVAGQGLAQILPAVVTLFAPERISIGGGLAGSYDLLAPALTGALDALTFQRRPEVVTATLGSAAGLVGAGLMGWDACRPAEPGGDAAQQTRQEGVR